MSSVEEAIAEGVEEIAVDIPTHCTCRPSQPVAAAGGEVVCYSCGKLVEKNRLSRDKINGAEAMQRIYSLERQMRQFQLQLQELKSQVSVDS